MSMGTTGFIYGMNSMARMGRLIKKLKEKDVLDQDYKC